MAPTVVAQEEIGSGGIGGRPAYPQEDNARTESIFVHTIEPGQTVEDGINIINNDAETKTITVYATDSVVSSGGAFACEQLVESDDEVGSWVSIPTETVTLESASSTIVDFTITVPENTSVGEHDGCIVVQEVEDEPNPESGIGLSFRTAIRMAILVPGDIEKNLEITSLNGEVKDDGVITTTTVNNLGNVSVDTDITTTLSYFWGQEFSDAGGQFPVLRGEEGEWNFEHERPFWGGWYQASVRATYDSNPDTFIGTESGDLTELTYPSIWIFVWPQPVALAIELVFLLAIVILIILAIRRLRLLIDSRQNWKRHTAKSGEDIRSIAQDYGVSWRSLAKVNKLKAPYTIKVGDEIKVPSKKADK